MYVSSRALDVLSRALDGLSRALDGLPRALEGLSRALDGLSRALDGLSCALDGLSRALDGSSRALDGSSRALNMNGWNVCLLSTGDCTDIIVSQLVNCAFVTPLKKGLKAYLAGEGSQNLCLRRALHPYSFSTHGVLPSKQG